MRERLATLRTLERAKTRHREAYAEYRATEEKVLSPLSQLNRRNLDRLKQARKAAFKRYEASAAIVERLRDRLEGAAKRKKAGK